MKRTLVEVVMAVVLLAGGSPVPRILQALAPASEQVPALTEVIRETLPSVVRVYALPNTGSGEVIDEEGHILTNYHVVQEMRTVWVNLSDGRWVSGEVIGTDQEADLAVISIKAAGLTPIRIGQSSSTQLGDEVLAIGYPLDLRGSATVTRGIISAKRTNTTVLTPCWPYVCRPMPEPAGPSYLQFDAALNHGGSGGALVNRRGELIGINTSILRTLEDQSTVEGIAYAIPIDEATPVARRLVAQAAAGPRPAGEPAPTPVPTPSATAIPTQPGSDSGAPSLEW